MYVYDINNIVFSFCLQLLDTRIAVLVDTVGPGVPVDVGQPGVFDQHRQTAAGQVARQTDNHVQSETRDDPGSDAVLQSSKVCCEYPLGVLTDRFLSVGNV